MIHFGQIGVALFLLAGVMAAIRFKKLTPAAAVTGGLLGAFLYLGCGIMGLALMALFFLLGTLSTSWKKERKQTLDGNAAHQPTRKTGQVVANAGVAAACSLLGFLLPDKSALFQTMMAGSFAAATADTLSSELGTVYGRRFFNILTLKPDQKGLDGVVSIEGTITGLAGAALIGLVYTLKEQHLLILTIAGFIGNIFDSILGATLERKGFLNNDMVNFLNTLTGALTAAVLLAW